jgi:hypothetical protein
MTISSQASRKTNPNLNCAHKNEKKTETRIKEARISPMMRTVSLCKSMFFCPPGSASEKLFVVLT